MVDLKTLSDEQLGRLWANKFSWYLIEQEQGPSLDDAAHSRLCGELRAIDAERVRRGLPTTPRYTDAFCTRQRLPEEDIQALQQMTRR